MRRKNTVSPKPTTHYGNGTLQLSDVLNYFKGKTLQERECIFEAIRAMGNLGWNANIQRKRGRPPLNPTVT